MRTVFWEDNHVKMIDQRLLPSEFVLAEFGTVDEVAFSIRDMVVRGAPAIGAGADSRSAPMLVPCRPARHGCCLA